MEKTECNPREQFFILCRIPFAVLPPTEEGDLIAFIDTGAYCDASTNNFNALPRPGMVLVNKDKAEWIKKPESVEDVFRRDIIPARLKDAKDK